MNRRYMMLPWFAEQDGGGAGQIYCTPAGHASCESVVIIGQRFGADLFQNFPNPESAIKIENGQFFQTAGGIL